MAQEFFGGPEYFQEFDPEKFARELLAEQEKQESEKLDDTHDSGEE